MSSRASSASATGSRRPDYQCGRYWFVLVLPAVTFWLVQSDSLFGQDDIAPPDSEPAEVTPPADHQVSWLTSLDVAKEVARVRRAPILIKAGAEWCGYCRQLDGEMASSMIQDELQRWLPVAIDVDDQPRVARDLGIGPIPALRVLTPDGRLVAASNGFLPADELAVWLVDQHDQAALGLEGHLSQGGIPEAVEVIRIVREFGHREATIREAAIARLAPYPESSAAHVLARFSSGTLSERLTALELLLAWNAPVDGLDPWQPATITEMGLAKLETWFDERDFATPDGGEFSSAQMLEAERLLRMMTTEDAAAAAAMREQLARMGDGILPLLRDALERTDDEQARSRLRAARYRLAASGALVLRWPGGIERLAAQSFDERIAAVDELTMLATAEEEELLLALFSDPAPLVRELALRSLKDVSGEQANSALVKLLDDPDPNVRAAVLKELAESPSKALVPKIASYVEQEQDPDLVVHSVRFLNEVEEPAAVNALLGLLTHTSWRVRAEAAAGVTRLAKDYNLKKKIDQQAIQNSFIKLLEDEDSFVVSRAAAGLESFSTSKASEPLIEAAKRHPDVAPDIIRVLVETSAYRSAIPFVEEACRHASPAIRAAAVSGLVIHREGQALPQFRQALDDEELTVRIAAIDALFDRIVTKIDSGRDAATTVSTASAEAPAKSGFFRRLFGGGAEQKQPDDERPADKQDETDDASPEEFPGEEVLRKIRDERTLPDWIYRAEQLLTSQPEAEDARERVSVARVLAVLGDASSLGFLMTAAEKPEFLEQIAESLPRLLWYERQALFTELTKSATSVSSLALAAEKMAATRDPRAPDALWELLASEQADQRLVSELLHPLLAAYFTNSYYNLEDSPPEEIARCSADCTRNAREGAAWQRLSALLLLMYFDRDAAVSSAEVVFSDAHLPETVRVGAFNVLLTCEEKTAARDRSVSLLEADESAVAETALAYLVLGDEGLDSTLVPSKRYLAWFEHSLANYSDSPSGPIVPEVPEGITLEQMERFRNTSDLHVAAQAGYLRVLHGKRESLPDVIAAWEAAPDDAGYRRLAYRAIAAVNDPAFVDTLERIYRQLRSDPYAESEVKEFYWTIRTMTGPHILSLRKQIRQDYDGDTLR